MHETQQSESISRRHLLKASALGAGLALAGPLGRVLADGAGGEVVNVGIIGTGSQGMVLLRDAMKIPGVKFVAVCDIWKYSLQYGSRTVYKSERTMPKTFVDYRKMLAAAKDLGLQAVIVATPDWMHAEMAVAAMRAGLDVYCEKEMSNTLESAAAIVRATRETKRICQIGHQRRSNPVYQYALKLLQETKACGRVTNCYGQWNRPAGQTRTWPERYVIDDATLKKYGYVDAKGNGSMQQFRNWRWYRKYSAGPIADLGSHQIDIFSWFLDADPSCVRATGGSDYYGDREWYEDVMAVYDYQTKSGSARAFYQVLNTNGFGHYYERFHGDKGTVTISEDPRVCTFVPEPGAELPAEMRSLKPVEAGGRQGVSLVEAAKAAGGDGVTKQLAKNIHQLHLENFFAAVRAGSDKGLTCPPEVAYPTATAVLAVNKAIESGQKVAFAAEQFKA